MPKRLRKPPRDLNSLAFAIVQATTGGKVAEEEPAKDPAAVALGRKGGKVGGKRRAEHMTPEQRSEAARKAALSRWSKPR